MLSAAYVVVMAASAIYSAISGSNTAKANARAARAAAVANVRANTAAAIMNRDNAYALANINAQTAAASANFGSKVASMVVDRNIGIINAQREYNGQLLDREEDLLWDQLELDVTQRDRVLKSDIGLYEAEVSGQGVVIGEGSTKDVAEHIITEASFDEMVMRHNADIKATDILNARARGEWEAQLAIEQTVWDGMLSSAQSQMSAAGQIAGMGAQTIINSSTAMNNTMLSNWATRYNAGLQAQQYDAASNQALVSGLFNLASIAASSYGRAGAGSDGGGSLMTGGSMSSASHQTIYSGSVA